MHDPVFRDASGALSDADEDTYALLDARGVVIGWGPGAERLLGYTAREVHGWRGSDLLVRRTELGHAVLRHRSGRGVEVALHARPMESTTGDRQWLIQATDTDATRRHELSEALIRGLFTESPFLIDVFDTQLRFIAQNDALRRGGGFANEEFVGRTMSEVAPPDLLDMEALEARQRRVLETGEALVQTEVRGLLRGDPDRQHVWSETILPLRSSSGELIALAHAVADVTERARARERLALINDASTRIGTTLDVLHTAQELVDVAVPEFADHAYVNLPAQVFGGVEPLVGPVGEAETLLRAATSSAPGTMVKAAVATGDPDPFTTGPGSLFTRAMASGEPLLLTGEELIAELTPVDPRQAERVRAYGVHSWLLVPMSARGAVLGAAVFVRHARAHGFEPDDVLLAEEIAARAAVCIDNASRYTRERTASLALRRSLLPQRLPVLGALEAVTRYLPAHGHAELGGAWYDVIPLSGARVALVVGDAQGHGLNAAVTMGRLRTAVRTLADLDLSPDELLSYMDDQIHRFVDEHGQDEFSGPRPGGAAGTTCVYAVFDPISRQCAVACAGHPPPVLAPVGGEPALVALPAGPPLGFGGSPFESAELTLDDGDVLVLYTHGLVAAPDRSVDLGLERIPEALAGIPLAAPSGPGRRGNGLGQACDAVIGRLLPVLPQDDVAVLMVRLHELDAGHHVTWDLPAEPEVVGRARTLATRQLTVWGLEELEFTTELVVSELVTNAIRYGSPPIQLRMIRDRELICEVSDGSSTSPHVRRAQETDEGGRGLFMVAQLAQLWGTRYHARGKTIWAEQPFPEGFLEEADASSRNG
ncbi:SpoIIE family protein phosphatase [Streptomyces sp. XY332]|uniref:SpoIIE family protein phosphatase n=1 Tax=Streptomyces sp. XY332 TaxID=1415561 RepID=UPI0006B1B40B|nr:SpoIIE family protein phosphatase [Streptomyces sp. XY332]